MDLRKQIYNVCLGRKKLKWEHSLPYVELFGLGLISGAIWEKALLTWFINNSVSSYFILTIGPTAAHHHPDIFHDGDEPLQDLDFGCKNVFIKFSRIFHVTQVNIFL